MDYNTLKDEVADWIHRSDLTAKMDIFIELAESQINKDLRVLEMEKRLEYTIDQTYMQLPDDYLEMRAFHIESGGKRRPIEQMSPQDLDKRYSHATGAPRAFTLHGTEMELRPGIEGSPLVTYPAELTYFARVPTIITNFTNTILVQYPMIYLFAVLVQANTYAQDELELQKYATLYGQQITQANKQAAGGRHVLPTVRSN